MFVTAYDQYAVQAFDAQAVDYLLKPVDSERLAACVPRLQRTLATRQGAAQELQASVEQLRALLGCGTAAPAGVPRLEVIQAQVGATVHLVPVDEVIYFEAADKYLRVITAEREHLIRTVAARAAAAAGPARASGRCTAARWCRRAASPARGATSRARPS